MTSIAVFLPNWVGDVVMATPVLRALRRHFGREARIAGILRPHLVDLLAGTDWLDEFWSFDPRSSDSSLGRWALVRRMRRQRPDLAVLLTNSLHTAVLAWMGGSRRRAGYLRSGRGLLLTDKVYPLRQGGRFVPSPMVDYYLALAEAVGCAPESPRLELATTDAEERRGEAVWRDLGLSDAGRVIALNCSGAYGAAKLWPAEHFAILARRLVDELDHDVLVLCGPQERDTARKIVRHADRARVVSLAEQQVSIGLSKACIRRCRLMVSTDSGPRHIAAAFDKPVVTLLGPTSPVWIANPTVSGVDLQLSLDCIPCAKRVCPLGHHRCMRDLSPDAVLAAVAKLLEEPSVKAA